MEDWSSLLAPFGAFAICLVMGGVAIVWLARRYSEAQRQVFDCQAARLQDATTQASVTAAALNRSSDLMERVLDQLVNRGR